MDSKQEVPPPICKKSSHYVIVSFHFASHPCLAFLLLRPSFKDDSGLAEK